MQRVDGLDSNASKLIVEQFTARGESPSFTGLVKKKEAKKIEDRVLAVGKHRIFIFRSNGKLDRDPIHLLDVEITSSKPNEVLIELVSGKRDREQLVFSFSGVNGDEFINACRRAFLEAFPSAMHLLRVVVEPVSRLEPLEAFPAPCGGFADSYRAVCDWMGLGPRDDVISNCTITLPVNNIREFDLADYEPHLLPLEELRAILYTLQCNSFFVALHAPRTWKLGERELQLVADVLRNNSTLQEIRLAGGSRDGMILLAHAIRDNKGSAISVIDFSHSALEDKAAAELGNALAGLTHGLVHLDLARAELGRTGVSTLCNSLRRHSMVSATLLELSLSHNKLEMDGSAALAQFLSKPNIVRRLRLNHCAANLDQLLAALLMGSPDLVQLQVSGNRITRKEGTQLVKYLQASSKLTELELADTQLPVDVLRDVFKAVFGNSYMRKLRLGLASNKLGVVGANMIANLWHEGNNIEELNLSDNELGDEGIIILCEALSKCNTLLKSLWLGENFSTRSPQRLEAMHALSTFINSPGCALSSLHFEGATKQELRADLLPLLNVLATNESLTFLDVSGHACGDRGILALARSLQTNHKLRSLVFDDNQTGASGFAALRRAMERNHTLSELSLPLSDIAVLVRSVGEAKRGVLDLIGELERATARNRVDRVSQPLVTTTTSSSQLAQLNAGERQQIERLRTKIQSLGRKLLPEQQTTMEDAERVEEHIAALLLLKESVTQQLTDIMKQQTLQCDASLAERVEAVRGQLVQNILRAVKDRFQILDADDTDRLHSKLGAVAHLSASDVNQIVAASALPEISLRSQRALQSLVDIASDFCLHHLSAKLGALLDALPAADAPRRPDPIPSRASAGQLVKVPDSPKRSAREHAAKPPDSPKSVKTSSTLPASPSKADRELYPAGQESAL